MKLKAKRGAKRPPGVAYDNKKMPQECEGDGFRNAPLFSNDSQKLANYIFLFFKIAELLNCHVIRFRDSLGTSPRFSGVLRKKI